MIYKGSYKVSTISLIVYVYKSTNIPVILEAFYSPTIAFTLGYILVPNSLFIKYILILILNIKEIQKLLNYFQTYYFS